MKSIDLDELKAKASAGDGSDPVGVSRRYLAQIAAELEAGRAAQAQLGSMFALQGKTL